MARRLTIGVVGLGFGEDFLPLYLSHPDVAEVIPVDRDAGRAAQVARRYGLARWETDTQAVLDDPQVDAVHIVAPVAHHADLTLRCLDAGKHTACAVPMATTIDDLERIIAAQERAGTVYMMMETSLFGREYFHARDLLASGQLGTPTFYTGFHVQNLDGYPTYWQGFPPMHYATHALSPALGLLNTHATSVRCFGSGQLDEKRNVGGHGNPYPVETAVVTLAGSDVVANVTMAFFQCARPYIEGFSLYGSAGGIEWPRDNEGPLSQYAMSPAAPGGRGNVVTSAMVDAADGSDALIPELRPFAHTHTFQRPGMPAPVDVQPWHSGSHPHLVQEFIASIVEHRRPTIDARRAAQLTAPGLCAHQSAMQGSEVAIPSFT